MSVWGSSGLINWDLETYPEVNDFVALPLFAIFFPAIRLFLDRYVFENLAKRLIFGKGHTVLDVGTHARRKKIIKFKESAWKCVYFLSAEILAILVSYDEPWFTNTKCFWEGPGSQVWPDQKTKLKLKGLYMYVAGFYSYSIFALIFWETRRSDFGVSMSHHIATFILVVLSYIFRFARVGAIVLAVHDASDVFLEIAKMSKYSGCEWIASVTFVIFVLSWTILRITYYPFWILWSTSVEQKSYVVKYVYPVVACHHLYILKKWTTSYEVLLSLDKEKHIVEGSIYYYLFNTLLYCLLVLNIYWWVLMVRMVVNQFHASGQVSDDVRSDSEGDDEHDD